MIKCLVSIRNDLVQLRTNFKVPYLSTYSVCVMASGIKKSYGN